MRFLCLFLFGLFLVPQFAFAQSSQGGLDPDVMLSECSERSISGRICAEFSGRPGPDPSAAPQGDNRMKPTFAQSFQGGPDGFGYYWESTQDLGDTITFSWLDPNGHQLLTGWFPNPDDGWVRTDLPFRFPLYGDTLDSIVVCSNGFLEFPVTFTSYENLPLPVSYFPYLGALFWDDLSPGQSGAVRRFNDPQNRFTAITWLDMVRFNTSETLSCQVLLYANGDIRMNILRAPQTANSNTIGIQGHSGGNDHFLEYAHNGEPENHILVDSTSIRFFVRRLQHDVGVLRARTPCGWLPAHSQCPVAGVFKNYGTSIETFPVTTRLVRTRFPHDTVFSNTRTISELEPGDTIECYFGDWLVPPSPDSWFVLLRTDLSSDMFRRNDTLREIATTAPPALGTILGSWSFPELGDGMNLGGIAFRSDSNRFYLAVTDPNRVFSFSAAAPAPELRAESFELQNFFGDDIIWGIAWNPDQPGFWLTHVSAFGEGCIAARYEPDGTFAQDTWDLTSIESGVWFAGLDQAQFGTVFAVAVGGANHIYQLDPYSKGVVREMAEPIASYRACSYLGDHNCYLFTGGWNQHAVIRLDIDGTIIKTGPLAQLADLDIYQPDNPFPDSLVWAYATTSSYENTIHKLALGAVWTNIGLTSESGRPVPDAFLKVQPNPVRAGQTVHISGLPAHCDLSLWDAAGRLIKRERIPQGRTSDWSTTDSRGMNLPAGVYLLTLSDSTVKLSCKLVVTTR